MTWNKTKSDILWASSVAVNIGILAAFIYLFAMIFFFPFEAGEMFGHLIEGFKSVVK